MTFKERMKKVDYAIEVLCSFLFAALACYTAYRVWFVPSEGPFENVVRMGIQVIGAVVVTLYTVHIIGWISDQRK